MTSSDGLCSPCWQTSDTATVPSQSNEETGESQVEIRSSWIQVPVEACSDQQSAIRRPLSPSTHVHLQNRTQNCQTHASLDFSESPSSPQKHHLPPVCPDNNTVQPFLGSGHFTKTSEGLADHGSVEDQGESVVVLHGGRTDYVPVPPVPDEDFSDTVQENGQDPLSTSASTVMNAGLQGQQLTETAVYHTRDLHAVSAVEAPVSLSQSPDHTSGQVSSGWPIAPVQLQERSGLNRSPRTHSDEDAVNLDPVSVAGMSPQPCVGFRNVTDTSEAHGDTGEHGKTHLVSTEMNSDGEIVLPVSRDVTAVDSAEENGQDPQSTCAECPSEGTVRSSEPTGPVVCHTSAVDTHIESAPSVCGLQSPSPVQNALIECSDYSLVELQNRIASVRTHRAHDMSSVVDPVKDEKFKQRQVLSNPANSNAACPDSEALAKGVPHTDCLEAADAKDVKAKEKQTCASCCNTQLINNHQHQHTQTRPDPSESMPYSLRRRRRGAPSSSSAPVRAKQSCPGLVLSHSPCSTPVEGPSQDAPPPPTVKRKRGRPRKIQQPVDLNGVSSAVSVAAEKADAKSSVCYSTVTQGCLKETSGKSLSATRRFKRKVAAATLAVSVETEGQENTDSPPLDPLLTLRTDTQQSQESSQEPPEVPADPSSDLSFEQILQDDPMPLTPLSLPEEEEEVADEDPEEEEELPSILERKPLSITEGLCVWCKFRKYPFWPAVVKSVNHKNKKASIVFIDTFLIDEKGIRKGLTVSLKTLKPFDCADAEELTEQAKQQYGDAITWCLDLIYDYRIRIGCGSFSGSFIEYFASDISCPLRQCSQGTSDLTFPMQLIVDDLCDSSEEEAVGEQADGPHCKKLLPDRAKAARTRANEKLVDFIVRKRRAEKRLLAVISGRETSKWLRAHQKASRFVVDPYMEDEEQVDKVYRYLDEFLKKTPQTLPCLANLERIPFILDVLLPEALICAIAGVDDISLEQAEEKYRKGPCISKRERQEFNMRIEQLMKTLNKCKQVL